MNASRIDLTPFGFTGTESAVYGALLELRAAPGATGYAVAQVAHLARANVYAALEGLVARRAAVAVPGKPLRYRAADPASLVATLAAEQAGALDRLERALRSAPSGPTTTVHEAAGERAAANVIMRLVARAEREVLGTVAATLWRATLPAWRRAAARAQVRVWSAGAVAADGDLLAGAVPATAPTALVIDGAIAVVASHDAGETTALWSQHPVFVTVALHASGVASGIAAGLAKST